MDRHWSEVDQATLAHRAGMRPQDVTAYFPSVPACAADALEESLESCYAACAAARSERLSCSRQFDAFIGAVLSWACAEPGMARLLFVVAEQSGERQLRRLLAVAFPRFVELFQEMTGSLPAGTTQTEFVIGSLYRLLNKELASRPQPRLAELHERARALAMFVQVGS